MEKSSHVKPRISIASLHVTNPFRRREVQREESGDGLSRLRKQLELHVDLSIVLDEICTKSADLSPQKRVILDHVFACTAWLMEHHPKGEDSSACMQDTKEHLDNLYIALTDKKSLKKLLGTLEQHIKAVIESRINEVIKASQVLQTVALKASRTENLNKKIQSDAIRSVVMDALLDKEGKLVPEILKPMLELFHTQTELNPPESRARDTLWTRLEQWIEQPDLIRKFNSLEHLRPQNADSELILRIQLKEKIYNPGAIQRLLLEAWLTPVVQDIGNCWRIASLADTHLNAPEKFLNSIVNWVEHGHFLDAKDPTLELAAPNIAIGNLKFLIENQSHTLSDWINGDTVTTLTDALALHPLFSEMSKDDMKEMIKKSIIRGGKKLPHKQITTCPAIIIDRLLLARLGLSPNVKSEDVPIACKSDLTDMVEICINALAARQYCLPLLLWQNTITELDNKYEVDFVWRKISNILLDIDLFSEYFYADYQDFKAEIKSLFIRSVHFRFGRNLDTEEWVPVKRLHWHDPGESLWRGSAIHGAEPFLKNFERMITRWAESEKLSNEMFELTKHCLQTLSARSDIYVKKLNSIGTEKKGNFYPLWARTIGQPFDLVDTQTVVLNTITLPTPVSIFLLAGNASFRWDRAPTMTHAELLADLLNRVRALRKLQRRSAGNQQLKTNERVISRGPSHAMTLLLEHPSLVAMIKATKGSEINKEWVTKHLTKSMNRLLQKTQLTPAQAKQFQREIMDDFMENKAVKSSKLTFNREYVKIRSECSLEDVFQEFMTSFNESIEQGMLTNDISDAFDQAVCKSSWFQSQAIVYADSNWVDRNAFLFLLSPVTFKVTHYIGNTSVEAGQDRTILLDRYPNPHI